MTFKTKLLFFSITRGCHLSLLGGRGHEDVILISHSPSLGLTPSTTATQWNKVPMFSLTKRVMTFLLFQLLALSENLTDQVWILERFFKIITSFLSDFGPAQIRQLKTAG